MTCHTKRAILAGLLVSGLVLGGCGDLKQKAQVYQPESETSQSQLKAITLEPAKATAYNVFSIHIVTDPADVKLEADDFKVKGGTITVEGDVVHFSTNATGKCTVQAVKDGVESNVIQINVVTQEEQKKKEEAARKEKAEAEKAAEEEEAAREEAEAEEEPADEEALDPELFEEDSVAV